MYYQVYNYNSSNWYTDGSCLEGNYGGFGFSTLQHRNENKLISNYGWIDHLTNVDCCEMVAIKEVLSEMINDNEIVLNNVYEYITVLTDSKFCCYSLCKKYYCEKEYYYWIVNEIFNLCNRLNQNGKQVRIVKIPAHKGFTGNELADFWAKVGAKMIDDQHNSISDNDIPLSVQFEINNKKLKKTYLEQREEERLMKKRKAKEQGMLAVNSNLYQGVLKNGSKCVVKEKEYLTYHESAIITMLRSEHIELNLYNCVIFGDGDANCDECEVFETVRHYLIDCTKYIQQEKN